MRLLFVIFFLLAAIPAFSQGCFRAIQGGREVTVICTGTPVFFEDCSPSPNARDIIFYDPGPAAFDRTNYEEDKLVRKGTDNRYQYTYTQPGTYRITQIINREGGGGTTIHERTFEVKASPEPSFTVTGCANSSVQVNITAGIYDAFDIDFGDGTTRRDVEAGIQPAYTYTGTGPYTLSLTGKYTGSSCSSPVSRQTINLLPPVSVPFISRLEVVREETEGELALTLQSLQPGYRYVVERFSPASATYGTVDTTEVITQDFLAAYRVTGINTAEATNYRVRPVDRCGTDLNATSIPVSSISLSIRTGDESAALTWTGINTRVQRYEITRDGDLLQTLDRSTRTYTNRSLSCGQNYCYSVSSISLGGISVSVSAQKCVTATSTIPPPAGYLYTTYDENNQVALAFAVPPGHEVQQVQFQRSMDGAPYRLLYSSQQTQLTDQLQTPTPACYRATYTNPCNLESTFSNTSCPVLLVALTQSNGTGITLGWTGYVGFPDGVGQYMVELLDENNQVISSYPASGNTFIDRNLSDEVQELRYRIKVTSGNGSAVSYSNTETIEQPLQVHVPTAFTPNNDGLNDVLEVKGRFIKDFRITVYNSMGHVVFQSNDRGSSWDGTYQGKPQPAGVYAYEINIITTSGEEKRSTGTVTLLR